MGKNRPVMLAGRPVKIRQLAKELGMDYSYLARILRGDKDPSTLTVKRAEEIAKALNFFTIEALIAAIRSRRRTIQTAA